MSLNLSNINAEGIENLTSKDVIRVFQAVESRFKNATKVFLNSSIIYTDGKNDLMQNIEVCAQVFTNKEQIKYVGKTSRSTNFSCINGVNFTELSDEDFTFELKYQKRFKETVK